MDRDAIFAPGFKTSPWWWEWAPLEPPATDPPPAAVDIAVIGGGFAGLSAALELRRGGVEVAVFEAGELGRGASSRNGGMVSGGLKLSHGKLADMFGAERATGIVDEMEGALPFIEELIGREGIDARYRRSGRFVGAWTPKHLKALGQRADDLNKRGIPAELIPRERQREFIGSDFYRGGLAASNTGSLHPALYHKGLVGAARKAGALLFGGTRIGGVTRQEGGFELATERGPVRAREVIAATNGYTGPATPWLQRRVIPIESYIIATEELPEDVAQGLSPQGRMLSDTKHILFYFRPSPDGKRMLFGGRASFRVMDERQAAQRLYRFMISIYPQLAGTRITHAWKGNVAFTFDILPHMGRHDGIHYCMGCNGSGVAMASYMGSRVALRLLGRENRPSALFDIPFPTKPFYDGRPWFMPAVGTAYKVIDWIERRVAA
jgi:glycine/D-amino acid oxidase-like deaminating enzyme